jgi:hypothetical protein
MRPEAAGGKFRCEGTFERELRARGFRAIAGVDEAGRGALFGPVVAAAVVLSPDRPVRGLNDSKLLEPKRREVLAVRIRERAVAWAIGAVDAATIDSINIYQASRLAMRLAVSRLSPAPDFLLTDAMPIELPLPQQPLIKGDAGESLPRRLHARVGRSFSAIRAGHAQRLFDPRALPGHPGVRHHSPAPPELRAGARALSLPRR